MSRWEKFEDVLLRLCYGIESGRGAGEGGGGGAEIARCLGRTRKAITQRAARLGLQQRQLHRPWRPEEEALLRARYRPGVGRAGTGGKIGRALGRTIHAVHARARDLGLCFDRRAEFGKTFEEFLRDKNRAGFSEQDVADAWGCCLATVNKIRRRLGLPPRRYQARHRAKLRRSYLRRLAFYGVQSSGEIEALKRRVEAAKKGWAA